MQPRSIRAVFFDVGGTLIAPSPSLAEIYARVLAPLGIQYEAATFLRAATETWAEMDALVGRGSDRYSHFPGGERAYWGIYVRRVLERLGDGSRSEAAADALHSAFSDPGSWAIFSEARETLRTLRRRGFRLGVISNWDSRLRMLLERLDLAREFDTIIVSCEVGCEKPSRTIFEHALAALGAGPGESFHVGDDLVSDYEGARTAGFEAALLVRGGGPPPPGTRALTRLDELPGLLSPRGASTPAAQEGP